MPSPIGLLRETGRSNEPVFRFLTSRKSCGHYVTCFAFGAKKASTIFKEVTLRAGVMNHLGRWVEPLPVPADNPLR